MGIIFGRILYVVYITNLHIIVSRRVECLPEAGFTPHVRLCRQLLLS